ncbi:MAG: porin [Cytophagales bacterium]|nr:porin [Cytophagales bacterium]
MKRILLSLAVFCLSLYANAQAVDSTATDDEQIQKMSIHGYVDTYYSYNLNNPANQDSYGSTGAGRVFYGRHNEMTIGLVQTKAEYTTDDIHIVTDLTVGPSVKYVNFGNTGTSLLIKQAYIEKRFNKLSLTVGQFGTHIGYELIDAPENLHYSLSYSFNNNPFYHTGIKAEYHFCDYFGLMVGVVNGWDGITDNNQAKSIISQAYIVPADGFEIYLNWIGGNEEGTDAYRHLFDLTSSYDVTDRLSLGLNASMGFNRIGQDSINTNWGGAVLYAGYELTDNFTLGIRAEVFDDTQGTRNLGAYYEGLTLTGSLTMANGIITIKPEIRLDQASKDIYFIGENNKLTNSQSTIGLSVIGKF